MKTNKIIATIILMLATILLLCTTTNAGCQSIPTGNAVGAYATNWIIKIRQMEEANQGMGLNETVNTTTGVATSDSNNIDVHLLKNTEYGAILLLGVSDYGKQGSGTARYMNQGATTTTGTDVKATTTGNASGIYELGYSNMNISSNTWEWVAGGGTSFLSNIDNRYVDRYTTSNSSAKTGDATVEAEGWHGGGTSDWLSSTSYCVVRGGGRTEFSFKSLASNSGSGMAHAAVVCGTGF